MPIEHELLHARRLTPPIAALAAFEAVARRGSFTEAAHELALTQSAVSRQISALENLLGVALFEGNRRKQVALTPSGVFYAERVRQVLSNLATATIEAIALGGRGRALRLGIPPTFGSRWLIPRIQGFFTAHPDIAVEFSTRVPTRPHQGLENLDALIDFAPAPGVNAEWQPILELTLMLVATPQIAQQLRRSGDTRLGNIQLLVHRTERTALSDLISEGELEYLRAQPFLTFESYAMLFQAANSGLGIGLAPREFIAGELSSGRLVPISATTIRSRNVGYMVYTPEKASYPPLEAFRSWLFEALRRETDMTSADMARDKPHQPVPA